MASIPVTFNCFLDDRMNSDDYDRKVVMNTLNLVGREIVKSAKKKVSAINATTYPGKITGRLRKNIKIHKAKRKDRFWIRVQIDTFKDFPFWYPAPLMYGRKDGRLRPRRDAVVDSAEEIKEQSIKAIQNALDRALKGWG